MTFFASCEHAADPSQFLVYTDVNENRDGMWVTVVIDRLVESWIGVPLYVYLHLNWTLLYPR